MKKKLIIIGSIVFIILIIIVCSLVFKKNDVVLNKKNSYNIEEKRIELPDTVSYTNDNLSKSHCLNDICISELVFYSTSDSGRIEYKVYNSSSDTKSGILRLNFSGKYLLVIYNNILPNTTISSFSGFDGLNITNKDDYVLEEYSGKDIIDKKK